MNNLYIKLAVLDIYACCISGSEMSVSHKNILKKRIENSDDACSGLTSEE